MTVDELKRVFGFINDDLVHNRRGEETRAQTVDRYISFALHALLVLVLGGMFLCLYISNQNTHSFIRGGLLVPFAIALFVCWVVTLFLFPHPKEIHRVAGPLQLRSDFANRGRVIYIMQIDKRAFTVSSRQYERLKQGSCYTAYFQKRPERRLRLLSIEPSVTPTQINR